MQLYLVEPVSTVPPLIGTLTRTPSDVSSGAIYAGETVRYDFVLDNTLTIEAGDFSLQLLTNTPTSAELYVRPEFIAIYPGMGLNGTDLRETLWAGRTKLAGPNVMLSWQAQHELTTNLGNTKLALELYVTGTANAAISLGSVSDNFLDVVINPGSHQTDLLYTEGSFDFYLNHRQDILWTGADLTRRHHEDIFTGIHYERRHNEVIWTVGEVVAKHHEEIYTEGETITPPLTTQPRIRSLRLGRHKLRYDGRLGVPTKLSEAADMLSQFPEVLQPEEAPSYVPPTTPRIMAAQQLVETSEAIRADLIRTVPGNILEVFDPAETDLDDEFYYDANALEWRLNTTYNIGTSYPLMFAVNTSLLRCTEVMFLLRYRPVEDQHTAHLNGTPGVQLLQRAISGFEEVKVWSWKNPVGDPAEFDIQLNVVNNTGNIPGFAGTGASILTI